MSLIRRAKISLVGAGQIGGILGLLAGAKKLGNVFLFDVVEGIAQGKALDLQQMRAVEGLSGHFSGGTNLDGLKDSDVVVVTAGVPRKPGMTRDDLLGINAKIVKSVSAGIKQYCPNAFVICITNPLDAMVQLLQRESGLPVHKVVGMAGVLDSSRFRSFIADHLKVSISDVHAMVLGGHGDSMVPLTRYCSISGIPLQEFITNGSITEEELKAIISRTRNGGAEIIEHLKTGSAFFAPAASAISMAEAYLYDSKSLLPCAAFLSGEYGVTDCYVGVPAIIGAGGVEKIVEVSLTPEEKVMFGKSVAEVKNLQDAMRNLGLFQ